MLSMNQPTPSPLPGGEFAAGADNKTPVLEEFVDHDGFDGIPSK